MNNLDLDQIKPSSEDLKKEIRDNIFSIDCRLIDRLRKEYVNSTSGGIDQLDIETFVDIINSQRSVIPKMYFSFKEKEDRSVLNEMIEKWHSGTSYSEQTIDKALGHYLVDPKLISDSLLKTSEILKNKEISVIFGAQTTLEEHIGESSDKNVPYITYLDIIGKVKEKEGYRSICNARQISAAQNKKYALDYFFSYLQFPSKFLFLYDAYLLTSNITEHKITFKIEGPVNRHTYSKSDHGIEQLEKDMNCRINTNRIKDNLLEVTIKIDDQDISNDIKSTTKEIISRSEPIFCINSNKMSGKHKSDSYSRSHLLGQKLQNGVLGPMSDKAFDDVNKRLSTWLSWIDKYKKQNNNIYVLTKAPIKDTKLSKVSETYLKKINDTINDLEKISQRDSDKEQKLESLKLIKKFFKSKCIRIIDNRTARMETYLNKMNLHDRVYFNDHASVTWGKGFDIFQAPKKYNQKKLRVAHDSDLKLNSIFSINYKFKGWSKNVWEKSLLETRYADLRMVFENSLEL